ncbi:MAG: 2-succinyl-5-enolpyruvyl-6-hydroxy-3-cyclohexene-1-carboxylic-acid synthase [Bacteroidota bacterium]
MISSAKKNVQLFVDLCVTYGLKHVVVSPGSRNAPLIIAFNQHSEIECIVVPDERVAAFFAMGMAQQTNDLVAVLCTSGSAPLNYYPAVAEAYYQRIPLIVITADRPQIWVNQGDGQTIVQHELFKNHINYSASFDDTLVSDDYSWYLKRETATAFSKAISESKGPIHFNFGFNEPLYQKEEIDFKPKNEKKSVLKIETPVYSLNSNQIQHLKDSWKKFPKKMIFCGQLSPNNLLQEELKKLSKDSSLVILVENTSNLVNSSFIHCIDRTLNSISEDEIENFSPDLLIVLGGAIVSKRIKAFLRKTEIKETWKVGLNFPFMDTFQSLTHSFVLDELTFFRELNKIVEPNTFDERFSLKWKQKDYLIQEKAKNYFENNTKFSDLAVFNQILDCIPENSLLHLANSSVIRYSLLFDPILSISYWSNRGTSGIDGSTSTAAGASFVKKDDWNTLITGDMSFFYDSNAFWNHNLTPNFRIFLINNGGGSIFKIIPGPDSTEELNDFFVFNNNFSAESICKAFGISYFRATNFKEIDNQIEDFYQFEAKGKPKLMEIFTSASENESILKDFFEKIKV